MIDLNGFTITGQGTGLGIANNLFGYDRVTIKNGTVDNFTENVIIQPSAGDLPEDNKVKNVTVTRAGSDGFQIQGASEDQALRRQCAERI